MDVRRGKRVLMWNAKNQHSHDYRRKLLGASGSLFYKPSHCCIPSEISEPRKKIFCLNYTQSDPDRWLTKWEKHQRGSICASFPISLLSLFLHLAQDRWILIPVVVSYVTVWDEISGENMSQWGRRKKIQQNIATDFNIFLNFRFFPLILIWNLNILIKFFHFTAALYFYSDSSKKGNGRTNPQTTQLCVLLLKNFSCLWELSLFYFFSLLLTTTKENLFFHLDYRSLHWLSIIHMSVRKWGVEDSALIWE